MKSNMTTNEIFINEWFYFMELFLNWKMQEPFFYSLMNWWYKRKRPNKLKHIFFFSFLFAGMFTQAFEHFEINFIWEQFTQSDSTDGK